MPCPPWTYVSPTGALCEGETYIDHIAQFMVKVTSEWISDKDLQLVRSKMSSKWLIYESLLHN